MGISVLKLGVSGKLGCVGHPVFCPISSLSEILTLQPQRTSTKFQVPEKSCYFSSSW